jgi:hypothetical protein
MEDKKKRSRAYYITMNEQKFEMLSRVMRLVFNDLQELTRIYKDLELIITPDDKLKFQKMPVKFDFRDAEFIKFIFNLYHLANKNHLDQNWLREWEDFKNELHLSQGRLSLVNDKKKLPRR